MRLYFASFILASTAACAETNSVIVELAPEVVSSLDGTLAVRATALADRDPAPGETVGIAIAYKDRHGATHDIAPVTGTTDDAGAFAAVVTGLDWDGTGAVTATVDGTTIAATATFAVLDRTPPSVTIAAPASNQVRIGNDVRITVRAKDEIGISEVFFEATAGNRDRSTVIASGSIDTSVEFGFKVENVTVGTMITLYALAADLSGNQAAAPPVAITVVP